MKNIMIIAELGERYYFDDFLKACGSKEMNMFIFDPTLFPHELKLAVSMGSDGRVSGFVDVLRLNRASAEKFRLSLEEIHLAWYLRENPTKCEPPTDLVRRFSRNESRSMLFSFYSILNCNWVNKKETVDFLCCNKLYQQLIAQSCGLKVPKTVMTNDPDQVVGITCPKEGVLLKTIGYTALDNHGKCFLYSERFSLAEIEREKESIVYCPVYAQEYVQKLYEYRVMVIGNQVLSCRIDSQASEKTKTDWRHYDFENVKHEHVPLPRETEHKLLVFVHKLGLKYGAIDLIETSENNFVFLEINPSGQWGWLSTIAGLPIAEAVADMLVQEIKK